MTLGTGIAVIFGFFGLVFLRSAIIAFCPGTRIAHWLEFKLGFLDKGSGGYGGDGTSGGGVYEAGDGGCGDGGGE